jgi:CRISPR-associated endonuclease/helicase Cas3
MQQNNLAIEKVLLCWGKTSKDASSPEKYHPALFHMIDTGNIAAELVSKNASPRWRNTLTAQLNLPSEELVKWVPFQVAIHDIGKISSFFQGRDQLQKTRLINAGFSLTGSKVLFHNQVGQAFMWKIWPELIGEKFPERESDILREMVGGHHGRFLPQGDLAINLHTIQKNETVEWAHLRIVALKVLMKIFFKDFPPSWVGPRNISSAMMLSTGFTILCDWLASDERFFPPQTEKKIDQYIIESREKAKKAVDAAGFFQQVKSVSAVKFRLLFPDKKPRPLQMAIDQIPNGILTQPCLAIIEAPTGEGKTEAALALSHRIGQLRETDEFYYALPTTATSDQMHKRVNEFLMKNCKLNTKARLVHGQAFLMEEVNPIKPLEGSDEPGFSETARAWFATKKKALLAPFGVGTIDQIELGALNVKHGSLRLSGLAGKVVILDEVHAYDTYMITIILRLLEWLSQLGTSVILLSATLPISRSKLLIQAYCPDLVLDELSTPSYPSIWISNKQQQYQVAPAAAQKDRAIAIDYLLFSDDTQEAKARWILDQIMGGGCACWITNTVVRAQEIFRSLKAISPASVDLTLIHSRFPWSQRQELEENLIKKYGPDKKDRPKQGIVIGTQVLEQSLDLDFDLMVSDLAPVDLLLQRAGRLFRHNETVRPAAFSTPKLFINFSKNQDGSANTFIDERIYPEYFLLSTLDALAGKSHIKLPADYRDLIHKVYEEQTKPQSEKLISAYNNLQNKESNGEQEARLRLIPAPDKDQSFTNAISNQIFEENENSAEWKVAQTRLAEPSISLIPLIDHGSTVTLLDSTEQIQKNAPASPETQIRLLQHSLRVSNPRIFHWFTEHQQKQDALFSQSALLRGYFPLWLVDNKAQFTIDNKSVLLELDKELGLIIS